MNPTPKCSSCREALCGLIYIDGKPFCDVCVRKRLADRDREITELKATVESFKSGLAESQMGDTVAEQAYRITCLEEALNGQLKWLDSAAIQAQEQARRSSASPVFAEACLKDSAVYHKMAEAIRAIWSPKPPSSEAKPIKRDLAIQKVKELREKLDMCVGALDSLYDLVIYETDLPKGAANGVVSEDGRDEGVWRSGEILEEARIALITLRGCPTAPPSSDQPLSAEAKPDPLQAVYERFKHLDRLLCETTKDEDNLWLKTAAALWLAVKAKVEGQPAGQTEQAKE